MSQAKQDFLSNTTSDKNHYIKMWKGHIRELNNLHFPLINASDDTEIFEEFKAIQKRLYELVQIAADEDFKND